MAVNGGPTGFALPDEQPRNALRGGDARVERKARVDLPSFRVLRAGERPGQGVDLRRREAAVRLRSRATQTTGIESAPDRIGDDAVAQPVVAVAGGEQAVDHRLSIRIRERAAHVGLSRRVEWRDAVEHGRDPFVSDAGEGRTHRRRTHDDAVEVRRIALRHQHALAPARRAAHEVRMRGGLAVVLRDDLASEYGHASDGLVGEVEARLLLRHEGRVEDLPAVTGVGRDDGEAPGERGIALPRPSERRRHRAVQAAPALEQEASVPLGGKRQREADAVALAVPAGAPVERRAQPAVARAA